MAAGLVAGAAALLLERYPQATVVELEEALRRGALERGAPGPDNTMGYGLLYIPGALDALGRLRGSNESPNQTSATLRQR